MKTKILLALLFMSFMSCVARAQPESLPTSPPNAAIAPPLNNREALETSLQKSLAALPVLPDGIYPFLPDALKSAIETNQPQAGDYLLTLAADAKSEWHKQAVGAFVQCWKSMSAAQITNYLQGAMLLTASARPRYHLSDNAYIRYGYTLRYGYASVPSRSNTNPEQFEMQTRTTHFVDGKQWQGIYEGRGPMSTSGWLRTGNLKLGAHYASLKMEFDWSYNGLKGQGKIESARFPFQIGPDSDAEIVTPIVSDESRQIIAESFTFRNPETAKNPDSEVINRPINPNDTKNSVIQPEKLRVEGPQWQLKKALPFALCCDIEIHDLATGEVFDGGRIQVKAGTIPSGYFVPDDREKFADTRDKRVAVKIVLQPSYELAIAEPDIATYFAEPIIFERLEIQITKSTEKIVPLHP